jgi:hypothetical protein
MKSSLLPALFASLLLSAAGCAAESTGTPNSADAGGSGESRTVDEITAEEATSICEYGRSAITTADLTQAICIFSGLDKGGDLEGCSQIFDQCMAELLAEPINTCGQAAASVANLPECASLITVTELRDCLHADWALVAADAEGLSCRTAPEDITESERPAVCANIDEQCPSLFDFDG